MKIWTPSQDPRVQAQKWTCIIAGSFLLLAAAAELVASLLR